MVWRAGVSAARGTHDDAVPWLLLQTPRQAAAARAELLGLLKAGVLQDALRERAAQAALTGAAGHAFNWTGHGTKRHSPVYLDNNAGTCCVCKHF